MIYDKLGDTDISVSKICLGTMTFGEQNTEADGHQQLDYAVDNGINFIDTAEMYSVPARPETYGRTEEIIGTWLSKRGKRDDIVLATKASGPAEMASHIRNMPDFTRAQLRQAVEDSLRRLQTDYIDLYQLDWQERHTNFFGQLGYHHKSDDLGTPFREILEAFTELKKEGKIREVGISNETPWGMAEFEQNSAKHGLARMMSIQNPYCLLNRVFEIGLAEMAIRNKTGLLAYSPLGFGVLSGKYLNGQSPANARVTLFPRFARYSNPAAIRATEQYVSLAKASGLSPSQMALAYVNSRDFVTSNIIGATTMDQLKENIGSISVELSSDVLEQIEKIHLEFPNPSP